MEYQAEATAYLVLHLINAMDEQTATYSRGYLKHWLHDETPPEQAAKQVLAVSDRMWRAGRLAVEEGA
jgi:hypothetical protein